MFQNDLFTGGKVDENLVSLVAIARRMRNMSVDKRNVLCIGSNRLVIVGVACLVAVDVAHRNKPPLGSSERRGPR